MRTVQSLPRHLPSAGSGVLLGAGLMLSSAGCGGHKAVQVGSAGAPAKILPADALDARCSLERTPGTRRTRVNCPPLD